MGYSELIDRAVVEKRGRPRRNWIAIWKSLLEEVDIRDRDRNIERVRRLMDLEGLFGLPGLWLSWGGGRGLL